jgi:hypothetical protein
MYSTISIINIFTIYGFLVVFISIIILYTLTEFLKSKTVLWISTVVLMIIYDSVISKNASFVSRLVIL